MGFYSPQTLIADARRHGVTTHPPDLNLSLAHPTLEPDQGSTGGVAVRLGLARPAATPSSSRAPTSTSSARSPPADCSTWPKTGHGYSSVAR
ncbi:MAG TPA: hypothetical protein VJT49_08040 [Amycolatopsis sp.]|nr:hypothetical protein [Amycolatopsis sp.]HKS45057.1 hypothetical protein [Amycolatopsis sp.]